MKVISYEKAPKTWSMVITLTVTSMRVPGSHGVGFGARHDSMLALIRPIESLGVPMRRYQ